MISFARPLIPLAVHHLPALRAIAQRTDFGPRYATVPESDAAFDRYFSDAFALDAAGKAHVFALLHGHEVVGTTRLVLERWSANPDRPLPDFMRTPHQAAEIGWTWLAPEARGTGLNTSAKFALLHTAFEELGLQRVCFKSDARNARSRAALEKLGARFDGVLRAHSCAWDNTLRDTAFYSITADEWPGLSARAQAKLTQPRGT